LDTTTILKRIDAILSLDHSKDNVLIASECYQGTLTLLAIVHGHDSPQVRNLEAVAKVARATPGALVYQNQTVSGHALGILRSLRAEVVAGLSGSIQLRGAGASLGDILGLAKDALQEKRENPKNVAAVLAAAAYEDTLRRMGDILAEVPGRPDLQDVIIALNKAQVLQGASVAIASGYLKFRNDALHADWSKIDAGAVQAVIAFVEGLLLKHFS